MISPKDIIDYTDFGSVKARSDEKLKFDIIQAKQDIFRYCGHDFKDYEEIPDEVKLAFIKLSEYYALINSDEANIRGIKSESLGDYSYTLQDGTKNVLSLRSLLDAHVKEGSQRGTKFRMRVF